MNRNLKPYNAKNYRKNRFLMEFLKYSMRGIWVFVLCVLFVHLEGRFIDFSQDNELQAYEMAQEKVFPENSASQLQVREAYLYGNRQSPVSYVEASLPLDDKTEDFDLSLSWNDSPVEAQEPVQHRVQAISKNGLLLSEATVDVLPRADIDGDKDVDDYDLERFKRAPFDLNKDGFVNSRDQADFKSWVGWRNYQLVGWKRYK